MLETCNRYSNVELLDHAKDFYASCQNSDVEQFMDILAACNAYDLELSDEEILKLQPLINKIWLDLEADQSLQHYVDMLIKWMVDTNYSVDEVVEMGRYDVVENISSYYYMT